MKTQEEILKKQLEEKREETRSAEILRDNIWKKSFHKASEGKCEQQGIIIGENQCKEDNEAEELEGGKK